MSGHIRINSTLLCELDLPGQSSLQFRLDAISAQRLGDELLALATRRKSVNGSRQVTIPIDSAAAKRGVVYLDLSKPRARRVVYLDSAAKAQNDLGLKGAATAEVFDLQGVSLGRVKAAYVDDAGIQISAGDQVFKRAHTVRVFDRVGTLLVDGLTTLGEAIKP